jgi:hypothetical protein
MCDSICHGCQICFEDKLVDRFGEEWWLNDEVNEEYRQYASNIFPEEDDTIEELPF